LIVAIAGSVAWLALVRWRTARHQHALWKSLALSAGGVALGWMLTLTLMMPPLDYVRSNRPLVERLAEHLPANVDCIAAPGHALATLAALEFQGHWKVEAERPLSQTSCSYALQPGRNTPEGWEQIAAVRRPSDRTLSFIVLRRIRPAA